MSVLILVACFLTAFIVRATVNWIDLIPWRKSVAAHWTERSRILWPVRNTNRILLYCLPLLLAVSGFLFSRLDIFELVTRGAAAVAGVYCGGWLMTLQLYPEIHLRDWLHELIIDLMFRFGIWLVFAGVVFTMPDEFTQRTWLTLGGMLCFIVALPTVSLLLLRLLGVLKRPGIRLSEIVADCARNHHMEVSGLWQLSGVQANALALPLSGTLVFCDRLLEILNDEEVAAVCDHELGHLAESRWIILGRYVGTMAILPSLLVKPMVHQWGLPGVMATLLLVISWGRLARKLVHQMELRADIRAFNHQARASVYAKALEKIYQANRMPAVTPGNNLSHPHLYDRMLAAGTTPEFPRPQAPRRLTILGWLVPIACLIGLIWIPSHCKAPRSLPDRKSEDPPLINQPAISLLPET